MYVGFAWLRHENEIFTRFSAGDGWRGQRHKVLRPLVRRWRLTKPIGLYTDELNFISP